MTGTTSHPIRYWPAVRENEKNLVQVVIVRISRLRAVCCDCSIVQANHKVTKTNRKRRVGLRAVESLRRGYLGHKISGYGNSQQGVKGAFAVVVQGLPVNFF